MPVKWLATLLVYRRGKQSRSLYWNKVKDFSRKWWKKVLLQRLLDSRAFIYNILLAHLRVREQRNILHEIRKRKANWIGHILRRNCLLKRVTEGKIQGGIEVTGRQGRRRRKLLDDLKESRGYSHLKEEALDRTMWRARFGRGFGPVVRQTTNWMNWHMLTDTDRYDWQLAHADRYWQIWLTTPILRNFLFFSFPRFSL